MTEVKVPRSAPGQRLFDLFPRLCLTNDP